MYRVSGKKWAITTLLKPFRLNGKLAGPPAPERMGREVMLQYNAPDLVTKNLAFNAVDGKRKARVSSNFLQVMGFNPGERLSVIENAEKHTGFSVISDPKGAHKVYSRSYVRKRSNNPLEAVIEFGGQSLINRSFPAYTKRFHIEMRDRRLVFSPLMNRVHSIHSRLNKDCMMNAFVGLTGGVDIHCMEALGWSAEVVLEHRPVEARDKAQGRNLTEVHALNTLVNGSPRILLNEDIFHVDIDRLQNILADVPPIALCHYSLGCDDHSPTKSRSAKDKSLDDLSTMYDMVYPMLKQVEVIQPAAVMVENVKQFQNSGAGKILTTTLKRLGYYVTEMKLKALDVGALQGRERYYMVASIYPGFESPDKTARNNVPLKSLINEHLKNCRDVTDTKSIASRVSKGRNMPDYITLDSLYSPTFLKSQDRGIADAIYIENEGRIYKPSQELMQKLMSIPDEFNVNWMAKEQAIETLGQSIDYKLHHAVMESVTQHIKCNVGARTIVKHGIAGLH